MIIELTLPDHWASALINGDMTAFDDAEHDEFNKWLEGHVKEYGSFWCLSKADESEGFLQYHDARSAGVLACDCSIYTFEVPDKQ